MLKKVYEEQKMANKSLQRITNLILMIIFALVGREAASRGDETGKILCRIGLGLNAAAHILMITSDISDLVKLKKEEEFEEACAEG